MKKYTIGIYFDFSNQKVALILKNRPEWQKGKFNFPGGHNEPNETSVTCITREFKEECGVEIPKHEWFNIGIIIGTDYEVDIFTSRLKKGHSELKTMESEPVDWYDINNLPVNVIPNINYFVPFALNFWTGNGLNYGTFIYKD